MIFYTTLHLKGSVFICLKYYLETFLKSPVTTKMFINKLFALWGFVKIVVF